MQQFEGWSEERWAESLEELEGMGVEFSAKFKGGRWVVKAVCRPITKTGEGRTISEALAVLVGESMRKCAHES